MGASCRRQGIVERVVSDRLMTPWRLLKIIISEITERRVIKASLGALCGCVGSGTTDS